MLITPGWGTEVPGRFKESQLLEQIRVRAATLNAPGLVVGPGDDCAVVQTAAGSTVLLTVDQLTVGRHVTAATSIDLIARKAIARSVSDIAAMAAVPKWSLVSGLLSDGMSEAAANELCESLHRWGLFFDAPVVGGDIASGPADGPLTLSVTVMGELAAGDAPVLRSGAVVGDAVFVSGVLGGSFDPVTGGGKHLEFMPRVALARALRALLGRNLHAMMDISDGLGRDAARMARASNVTFEIDAARLPQSTACKSWRNAMGDGEDYELLFTLPSDAAENMPVHLDGITLTRIGEVKVGQGCWVHHAGERFDAQSMGWDHGASGV